jgi:hypothetical protein
LRALLDARPGLADDAGDLARLVEEAWIERIAGSSLLHVESLRRRVETMKRELITPDATPLEKLLAGRIVIAWLAAQHSELAEAVSGNDGQALASLKMKRAESANRRLVTAATALAKVRRLLGGLHIEVHHHDQADDREQPGPARQQLREALVAGAGVDRELMEVTP